MSAASVLMKRVALYKSYEYQHAGPNTQGEQTEEKEETAGETETSALFAGVQD